MPKIDSCEHHTTDELQTFIPIAGDILYDKARKTLVVGTGEDRGGSSMALWPVENIEYATSGNQEEILKAITNKQQELIELLLTQLKINNLHLSIITGNELKEEDIQCK